MPLVAHQGEVVRLGIGTEGKIPTIFLGLVRRLNSLAFGLEVVLSQTLGYFALQSLGQLQHHLTQHATLTSHQAQGLRAFWFVKVMHITKVWGNRTLFGLHVHHLAEQGGAPTAHFTQYKKVVIRPGHAHAELRSLFGPRLPDPGQRLVQQLGGVQKTQ